jgi:hypothetical protein
MKPTRITEADLAWWFELAATLPWTFAKTYAETAPHSYIVLGRTPVLTRDDFIRAGAVIRTFGQPGKFYNMTNIYLTSPDGVLKWWAMDAAVADTGLINQATTDRVYGEQNAPDTRSTVRSVYDEIATQYDDLYSPVDGDERTGLLRLLEGRFDNAPTTLDIGCGTGAVLDLGITTPDRYTGLDPSQAMLNELTIKQRGKVAEVIPSRLEDAIDGLAGREFDLVIAAFGSATYLDPTLIRSLSTICSNSIVLMTYRADYLPGYEDSDAQFTTAEALRSAATPAAAARVTSVGKFDVVTIRKRN